MDVENEIKHLKQKIKCLEKEIELLELKLKCKDKVEYPYIPYIPYIDPFPQPGSYWHWTCEG